MLNIKTVTLSLSFFFALSFIFCVAWGAIVPDSLHMHQFLENILPGFKWISVGTFFLGLIESFLWGVYIGVFFVPVYNFFFKRQSTAG